MHRENGSCGLGPWSIRYIACILRCTHICGRVQFDGDIVCVYIYIYIHTYRIVFQFKPGRTEKCGYKTYKTQQNGMFFSDIMAIQWVYKMGIYPAANVHNTFYGNPSGFPFELFHSYIKLLEAAHHKKWDNYLQYEILLLVYPQYEKTIMSIHGL